MKISTPRPRTMGQRRFLLILCLFLVAIAILFFLTLRRTELQCKGVQLVRFTQEQLSEKVYVSRLTVSKWETGRGVPNLGSLQQLVTLFSLSLDDLLSTNELVSLARSEVEHTAGQGRILLFGILDFLVGLLLFLPLFTNGTGGSVALFSFSPIASFLQPLLVAMVALLALIGVFELAVQ
ncbi:hypothetical protein SDC9_132225 [bioreactor metagenome]|uniref:HTH cro/C1-type domain-containing protein n=1 Tax=bioreactor metagenome TaxID=1076179 RepID=A0A645D7W1_9ZZZZ